jgi:hypothetical protein
LFNWIKDYSSNPELDPFSLWIGENPIILNMWEIKKVKKIIYYETCIEYACYYYTNMGKSVMISQDGTNFSYMDKNYFTTTEHVEVNMYFNMPSNISTREIEEWINVQYISFMTWLGQEEALIGHEADIYISCE